MQRLLMIGTGPDWPVQKKAYLDGDGGRGPVDAVGIDILPAFLPDYVRDVLRGLPFSDNTFDIVKIHHVLEHIGGMAPMYPIDNYDFVISEIHRVLKPGGIVDIEVPYFRDDIAVEAAGHVRFFSQNSFINYYHNPHAASMGQVLFSECVSAEVVESGRSGESPARVVRVTLKK